MPFRLSFLVRKRLEILVEICDTVRSFTKAWPDQAGDCGRMGGVGKSSFGSVSENAVLMH